MSIINIQAAKTQLSRLVEEAVAGKQIVIGKAGRPMVVLTPWRPSASSRIGGQLSGQVWESEDCWADGENLLEASGEDPGLFEVAPVMLRVAEDCPP